MAGVASRRRSERPEPPVEAGLVEQVRLTLKHFHQPQWLGKHSPLAAPYFLAQHPGWPRGASAPAQRGEALRGLLLGCIASLDVDDEALRVKLAQTRAHLDGAGPAQRSFFHASLSELLARGGDHQRVLYAAFLCQPRLTIEAAADRAALTRATFYRHLDAAIALLSAALVRSVNPALRLEAPAQPALLAGRSGTIEACLSALGRGRRVGIYGEGGSGKTSLGAAVASRHPCDLVFWYTLRPGLNDSLSSVLFSLSYALHTAGVDGAWQQLLADGGKVRPEVLQPQVQHDVQRVAALLCFDELDALRPGEVEAHAQLCAFVESLRGVAPSLLLGRQPTLAADDQHVLGGLAPDNCARVAASAGLRLDAPALARLHDATHGNPRLLELCVALRRTGATLDAAMGQLALEPSRHERALSVEQLLRALWRQLSAEEQHLLLALAVFRRSAPRDAWAAAQEQATLDGLIHKQLVQEDGAGGIALLPAYRAALQQLQPRGLHEAEHLRAATIRADRGEYTAAAYHYVHAGEPRIALWEWHRHRVEEINQGQAAAAISALRQISPRALSDDDRRVLATTLAELALLTGDSDAAVRALGTVAWPVEDGFTAIARRLEGHVADLAGRRKEAIAAYRAGLATTERLASQLAQFHKNIGWMGTRLLDQRLGWREACLARYEAANLQGYVQEQMQRYDAALQYYEEALAIAQELSHAQGEANTLNNLARLLAHQGDFVRAQGYAERAEVLFRSIGKLDSLASVLANRALHYNLAGHPTQALEVGRQALALFRQLDQRWGIAVAAQNLAEAHQALGQLDEAALYARQVVDSGEARTLPDGLRVLGEVWLAQGRLDEAETLIERAVSVARTNHDRYLEAYAWRALAKVFLAQGSEAAAEEALDRAIGLFDELGLVREIVHTNAVRTLLPNASNPRPAPAEAIRGGE